MSSVLKLKPIVKSALWGGNYFQSYKGLNLDIISELWELSVRGIDSSIVDSGINKGKRLDEVISNEDIVAWISDSAQTTSHFNILKYEKGLSPLLQRIDETAPLYYVDEETKFSRILLMSYEEDLPNRVIQNELLLSTVKNFNKDADIELKILNSWHCHGSSVLDDDNEYECIKIIKNWFKI